MRKYRVQQIACTVTVHGRDCDRINRQLIKLVKLRRRIADRVTFINAQHQRLVALDQHMRFLGIGSNKSGAYIGHHDDHIGGVDRQLRLLAHLGQDHIVRERLNAAGVDQQRAAAAPLYVAVDAVTRYAGGIVDDRNPLADQFIE